ncbi:IPT/TIG domain-containing protein [Paraflavitalea speifideaquila]|uniref:IPT/TIG domain-containing protein n=1 Tax=Paraflavitalea speifideaquila TaxID=3076558 RepID=UPI0028F1436C|nr:IPT/TIG domain-containing protein [Paraflavitalea speifideiaquila]
MNNRQALAVLQVLTILLAALALQSCGKKDKPKPGPDPQPGTPGNPTLEITSFAPTTGMPGGEVIIQGKHFKDNIIDNTVYFNGVPASYAVLEATTTRLKVKIPWMQPLVRSLLKQVTNRILPPLILL